MSAWMWKEFLRFLFIRTKRNEEKKCIKRSKRTLLWVFREQLMKSVKVS